MRFVTYFLRCLAYMTEMTSNYRLKPRVKFSGWWVSFFFLSFFLHLCFNGFLLKYVGSVHGRLARWRKWSACDVGEATEGFVRMSCEVVETTEGLENELWRRWSDKRVGIWGRASFSNLYIASPTSQLILQPFRCFTYVTRTLLTSLGEPPMVLSFVKTRSIFIFHSYFKSKYVDRGRRVTGISGSLIWSETLMELIFNPWDKFRWSPEGPVSQIHSHFLPWELSDLLSCEGWLGFPDLWSGQKPWWNWYLTPLVNFDEIRWAQLAKSTLLTSSLVPLGSFQIF